VGSDGTRVRDSVNVTLRQSVRNRHSVPPKFSSRVVVTVQMSGQMLNPLLFPLILSPSLPLCVCVPSLHLPQVILGGRSSQAINPDNPSTYNFTTRGTVTDYSMIRWI
jgi:hypothetical protein